MNNSVERAMSSGLGLGVFFSLNFLVSMITVPFLGMGLQIWMMFMIINATRNYVGYYRYTLQQERFTFWQGYRFIVMLYFFASIISCGFKIVCLLWIFPDYLTNMSSDVMRVLSDPSYYVLGDLTEEKEALKMVFTPVNYSLYWIWIDTLLGMFVALPAALSMRRKTTTPDKNDA